MLKIAVLDPHGLAAEYCLSDSRTTVSATFNQSQILVLGGLQHRRPLPGFSQPFEISPDPVLES